MIYVYAIADGRPPRLRENGGYGGRPLRVLEQGRLAAVYCEAAPRELHPTEDALWHHEHVIEEVMADRPVLPLRFASTLPGEAELRELLTTRGEGFSAALANVRGRAEMGVRVRDERRRSGGQPATTGRAYIAGKLERRRAAAELRECFHAELAALAHESTVRLIADPEPGFAGSYLVAHDVVTRFRSRCDELGEEAPGVQLHCTGPWPPFSFAEPEGAP